MRADEDDNKTLLTGPYNDSVCGRQHEGVVGLVTAEATPGSAMNRQGRLHSISEGRNWSRSAF